MQNIKDILAGINIPNPAQKIFVSLLKEGKASARTLSHRTGITRTSVYDQLKILRKKDLVTERMVEGTTFFEVGDVRTLATLLDDQVQQLSVQQAYLAKNLKNLIDQSQAVQPKIRFFEGNDGVKQLLKDILWYDDTTLYLYWPYAQMLDFLGEDFLAWFDSRRKAHGIKLKTIWGHGAGKIAKNIFSNDGKDVERRYLLRKNAPPMGFIIYDKKVAFVSSQKESFGFIIESVEFSSLQKMQFEVLWKEAKKKA